MKLPQQKTTKQQEISYIFYVNIIGIFSFQNRILFQNGKLSPMYHGESQLSGYDTATVMKL